MPDAKNMPDDLKSLAFRQADSVPGADSFPRDMSGLEQELRRFVPARAIWKVAVIAGLFAISLGAISYFVWWSLLPSAKSYAQFGNFACFAEGQYPESWREDAILLYVVRLQFRKAVPGRVPHARSQEGIENRHSRQRGHEQGR